MFIGATTENPSFEVIGALLSRARVYVLKALGRPTSKPAAPRAGDRERGLGGARPGDRRRRAASAGAGGGRRCAPRAQPARDVAATSRSRRRAYHRRAIAARCAPAAPALRQGRRPVLRPDLGAAQGRARHRIRTRRCTGCAACSTAAAIRSTSRGASLRMAIEDIGLADPRALPMALEAWEAYERLGSPEGRAGDGPGGGLPGRARRRAMPSTRHSVRPCADARSSRDRWTCRCACAMRRPA